MFWGVHSSRTVWLCGWWQGQMLLCPIRAFNNISAGWNSLGLSVLVSSSRKLRKRSGHPRTPFRFGLSWWFPVLISQPLMMNAGQSRSRLTRCRGLVLRFTFDRPVQSSRCWRLVFPDYLLSLLFLRCHPQAYHTYPISTLPEHLHSTILRTPKLPENTHKPMETSFHPPLTLVSLLANYPHSHYSPPSLGVPPIHTPFYPFHVLASQESDVLLGRSYTLCVRLYLMVSKLPVFILSLFIEAFSDSFHALLF